MISIDNAPLNLAHLHERRAERKSRINLYDAAISELKISLAHISDAYETVVIPKAIEVLDTQKEEYIRKIRHLEMRRVQFERGKLREVSSESNKNTKQEDSNIENKSEISLSKSIYETIEDFDAKFNSFLKENVKQMSDSEKRFQQIDEKTRKVVCSIEHENPELGEDFPSLDPLELPDFNINVFNISSPPSSMTANDK